jgi:hypothetical protein
MISIWLPVDPVPLASTVKLLPQYVMTTTTFEMGFTKESHNQADLLFIILCVLFIHYLRDFLQNLYLLLRQI